MSKRRYHAAPCKWCRSDCEEGRYDEDDRGNFVIAVKVNSLLNDGRHRRKPAHHHASGDCKCSAAKIAPSGQHKSYDGSNRLERAHRGRCPCTEPGGRVQRSHEEVRHEQHTRISLQRSRENEQPGPRPPLKNGFRYGNVPPERGIFQSHHPNGKSGAGSRWWASGPAS